MKLDNKQNNAQSNARLITSNQGIEIPNRGIKNLMKSQNFDNKIKNKGSVMNI